MSPEKREHLKGPLMFNIALEKMMVENPSFSFKMDWIFRGWRWTVKNFGGGGEKTFFNHRNLWTKTNQKAPHLTKRIFNPFRDLKAPPRLGWWAGLGEKNNNPWLTFRYWLVHRAPYNGLNLDPLYNWVVPSPICIYIYIPNNQGLAHALINLHCYVLGGKITGRLIP